MSDENLVHADPLRMGRPAAIFASQQERVMPMLEEIVKQFNDSLKVWCDYTGCTAQFGWGYDKEGTKQITISEVNLAIHRKAAPSAKVLDEAMKNFKVE